MILDELIAFGHSNVQCLHTTTIEVTKSPQLTKNGTCILALNSSKGCYDLDPNLKKEIWHANKIEVILRVDNFSDSFYGFGNKNLPLQNKDDIVFRKSNYICERTVLINCSKASNQINRSLIEKLRNPKTKLNLIFKTSKIN